MERGAAASKLAVSYSHSDVDVCRMLLRHLRGLERAGVLSCWTDGDIEPGSDWASCIAEAMASAEIILLLISADYFDSDYCFSTELPLALAQRDARGARVVPVIARPCAWEKTVIGMLQVLPADGDPIVSGSRSPDDALKAVAEGVAGMIGHAAGGRPDPTASTASEGEAMATLTDVSTRPTNVELTIDRPFESFTEEEQKRFLAAIQALLGTADEVRVIKKLRGSVKLVLQLPHELAATLASLVETGALESESVVGCRLLSDDRAAALLEAAPPRNWMEEAPRTWGELQALIRDVNEDRRSRRSFREWLAERTEADDHPRRGLGFFTLGDDRSALPHLEQVDGDLGRLLLGKALADTGDPNRAIGVWKRVTGHTPEARQAMLWTLELHTRRHESEQAEAALQRLREMGGLAPADTSYAEGLTAQAQGAHAEAVAKWRVALEDDPHHAAAAFALAQRLDLSGDDEEAIQAYERFLSPGMRPHTGALINLGCLYEDQEDYEKAKRCFQVVVDAEPHNQRARRYLAEAQASLEQVYDEGHERQADKQDAVLRIPVTDFELSVRARNCLQRMSIHTLGDLVCRTESELLSFKNFGETSLQEVKEILAVKGLRLGMMPSPAARSRPDPGARGDARSMAISELDLSVRSRMALRVLGIETVGDLTATSPEMLLSCKNFGATSLDEIRLKLKSLGMSLPG